VGADDAVSAGRHAWVARRKPKGASSKTRGGRLVIQHAKMGHMGSKAKVFFSHAGVYKLKTRAGEDYPNMDGMKTIGKDNDLRITVLVH
jgi:hypothetical protein